MDVRENGDRPDGGFGVFAYIVIIYIKTLRNPYPRTFSTCIAPRTPMLQAVQDGNLSFTQSTSVVRFTTTFWDII